MVSGSVPLVTVFETLAQLDHRCRPSAVGRSTVQTLSATVRAPSAVGWMPSRWFRRLDAGHALRAGTGRAGRCTAWRAPDRPGGRRRCSPGRSSAAPPCRRARRECCCACARSMIVARFAFSSAAGRPRRPSLPPSATISTRTSPSSAQSSRLSPPADVSPDTPALTTSNSKSVRVRSSAGSAPDTPPRRQASPPSGCRRGTRRAGVRRPEEKRAMLCERLASVRVQPIGPATVERTAPASSSRAHSRASLSRPGQAPQRRRNADTSSVKEETRVRLRALQSPARSSCDGPLREHSRVRSAFAPVTVRLRRARLVAAR